MITFKQYIAEDEVQTLENLLNGECQNYFKQSQKKGLLIRGLRNGGEAVGRISVGGQLLSSGEGFKFNLYKRTVRKARKPADTDPEVSKLIDDWFEDKMGIRARSEAVFCFGESGRLNTSQYGQPSVILPIGKFTYCWSPQVEDLYDVIREIFQSPTNSGGSRLRKRFIGPDGKPDTDAIDQTMSKLGYTINKFSEACAGSYEIMIDCEEYYAIPYFDEEMLNDIKKAYVHA